MTSNAERFRNPEHTSETMDARPGQFSEDCPACGRETAHSVSIELRHERPERSHTGYSREPYRVSVCDSCGATERLRMNDQ
jgi:hypothetical protein